MGYLKGLRARLRALLRTSAADRELTEEIRFHIELETEKNLRLGMSPGEARRLAMAHFGGVQRVREEHRDVRRLQWIEDFFTDIRFALRSLRRTPGLAGAAIVTLALGIGANVAIFSAVNAVVLQPLPFPAPDRLMAIGEDNPEKNWRFQLAAPANFFDWRAGVSDFADVTAYVDGVGQATLTGNGDPRLLVASYVAGNFFSTLGIRASLGRTFRDEDTWRNGTHIAILSDRAWRDCFGADPAIVGKSITVERTRVQVVGVMPPSFSYPREHIDLWQPLGWSPKDRGDWARKRRRCAG